MVSSALQDVPLIAAANDLERGLNVRGANVEGYATAIATIDAFERIPLTSETPAEVRASHRDWSTLNSFFHVTPRQANVLDHDLPSGAAFTAARVAWLKEATPELDVSALATVVSDLRAARAMRPSREIIYQAALVDALSLERASTSDADASPRTLLDASTQDIYYLNVFFHTFEREVSNASS